MLLKSEEMLVPQRSRQGGLGLSHLSHLGEVRQGFERQEWKSPMNRGVTCEIASIYGEFARAAPKRNRGGANAPPGRNLKS